MKSAFGVQHYYSIQKDDGDYVCPDCGYSSGGDDSDMSKRAHICPRCGAQMVKRSTLKKSSSWGTAKGGCSCGSCPACKAKSPKGKAAAAGATEAKKIYLKQKKAQ